MKKAVIFILGMMSLMGGLHAQALQKAETGEGRNIIYVDALPIVWGVIPFTSEFGLGYERQLAAKQSVKVRAAYLYHNLLGGFNKWQDADGNKNGIFLSGYRVQASYRYYLQQFSDGFYLSPDASYAAARIYDKKDPVNNHIEPSKLTLSLNLGWMYEPDDNLYVDISAGLGAKYRNWDYKKGGSSSSSGNGQYQSSMYWYVARENNWRFALPLNVAFGIRF